MSENSTQNKSKDTLKDLQDLHKKLIFGVDKIVEKLNKNQKNLKK